MNDVLKKVVLGTFITVVVVGTAAGVGLLLAFPVKWTWNVTMPFILELPKITWGKAWCINFLANCLIRPSHVSSK